MPGTNHEFLLGSDEFPPDGSPSTESLLTSLVIGNSNNFDLSAVHDHRRIERMSSIEMTNLLYRSFLGGQRREMSVPKNQGQSDQRSRVRSLYNIATVSYTAYDRPQARERLAYEAQERWLNLFRLSLSSEFELDQFSVLLATSCME